MQSEKSYERNIEEHSILVFIRPSKLTVDRESIDFTDKMLKSTLAKSIERLRVNRTASGHENDNEFEIIEEEECRPD